MRVQARQCPFTGKLFKEENIDKYLLHLEKVRKLNREKNLYIYHRNTFKDWLAEEKKLITNVDMIVPWFLKNQRRIMDTVNSRNGGDRDKFYDTDTFAELEFKNAYYIAYLSNTHSCPDTGVTNWSKLNGLPTGYRGWAAIIAGSLDRASNHMGEYPVSEALKLIGIKTGTGGGGNKNFSWSCSIFLDDWPGLIEAVNNMEKDQIVRKLKGV